MGLTPRARRGMMRVMDKTPEQILATELPRARRGFEETATRRLLVEVATSLSSVIRERDDLRKRVNELNEQVSKDPNSAEALGTVILSANRAAEDLVLKATDEAATLIARAEIQAETIVAEATASVESLRTAEESLRQSIAERRQELVTFLQSAVEQLDAFGVLGPMPAEEHDLDGDLLSRLPAEES
jgi:cell division septum initiation protein DivIVA